jgi:hypothetical protein
MYLTANYFELAVADTQTQLQPVRTYT